MTTEENTTIEPVETPDDTEAAPRRRGIRSGIWALVSALILILWVYLLGYLAILGTGGEEFATVLAGILGFASVVVIPLLIVLVLVFGIIALLINPPIGKILGALGILAPVIALLVFSATYGGYLNLSFFTG
jgi:hypothetical protein